MLVYNFKCSVMFSLIIGWFPSKYILMLCSFVSSSDDVSFNLKSYIGLIKAQKG